MCEFFGWVQGSDVPSKYVHLSGRDIDDGYDRLHGIEEEDQKEESNLTPKQCPRCGEMNGPDAKYCQRCGMALTLEASEEIEEATSEFREEFTELAEDQELRNKMKKLIKKTEETSE